VGERSPAAREARSPEDDEPDELTLLPAEDERVDPLETEPAPFEAFTDEDEPVVCVTDEGVALLLSLEREIERAGRDDRTGSLVTEVELPESFLGRVERTEVPVSFALETDSEPRLTELGQLVGEVTFAASVVPILVSFDGSAFATGIDLEVRTPSTLSVTICTPGSFFTRIEAPLTAAAGAVLFFEAREAPPPIFVTLPARSSPPIRPLRRLSR